MCRGLFTRAGSHLPNAGKQPATHFLRGLMNRRNFNLSLLGATSALAFSFPQSPSKLRVNGQRLNTHLTELAQFGKTLEGGTHRVAYTEADLQGREYTMKLMREAK